MSTLTTRKKFAIHLYQGLWYVSAMLCLYTENAPARWVYKATRTAIVIILDLRLQERTLTRNHAEIRKPTAKVRGHRRC
jgi:hypothetical protein